MNKSRYILKLKDGEPPSLEAMELRKLLVKNHVSIVDSSLFPKIILVEAKNNLLKMVSKDLKSIWNIFPEKIYQVPDTRKLRVN